MALLTFDVQVDRVGDAVALGVVGGAGIDPGVSPSNFLEDEALVRYDHLLGHVVSQLSAIMPPRDLVRGGAGLHGALEVHVVPLLDVGRVEAGAQLQGGAGNVCKNKYELSLKAKERKKENIAKTYRPDKR